MLLITKEDVNSLIGYINSNANRLINSQTSNTK